MKLSVFNTYLKPKDNLLVIYNAFTDNTLVLKCNISSLTDFKQIPEGTIEGMKRAGIIVEENVNEYQRFVEYSKNCEDDKKSFHLLVNPTLNCNFHCHYCYETHFRSKMGQKTMDRVKRLIARTYNERDTMIISFFGGEPMLYFEEVMMPIISYSQRTAANLHKKFYCNMTTNGFLLNNEKIDWLCDNNFMGVQITLDGEKRHHNEIRFRHSGDNTFDTIVSNIKYLAQKGVEVTLRLNCTKTNINGMKDIALVFNDLDENVKRKIKVDMHIVWQEKDKSRLSEPMDDAINAFHNCGMSASKLNFRDFCYADLRNCFLVNFNGDIFKCTARDFTKAKRDGFLDERGFPIWENDSLEKRMAAKFINEPCKHCRILPLCHGGCSTNALENNHYCLHDFSDAQKDEVVKNRIVQNESLCSVDL